MKHTPESTTHWACETRIRIFGPQTTCCACIQHDCASGNFAQLLTPENKTKTSTTL